MVRKQGGVAIGEYDHDDRGRWCPKEIRNLTYRVQGAPMASLSTASSQVTRHVSCQSAASLLSPVQSVSGRFIRARHANGTHRLSEPPSNPGRFTLPCRRPFSCPGRLIKLSLWTQVPLHVVLANVARSVRVSHRRRPYASGDGKRGQRTSIADTRWHRSGHSTESCDSSPSDTTATSAVEIPS